LRDDLAAFPTTAKADATPIMLAHARRAHAAVKAAYPVVTGALRDGVRILERVPRGIAVLYTVVTSAPHAHIYEFGSVRTRPTATFLPITERERRASVAAVAGMVEGHGLEVRGARD
jgi:hypothetical protein